MEQEFIRWLRQRYASSDKNIKLGIGDDAAVFAPESFPLVVACDSIADGTHFDSRTHALRMIGRKAIAVNLSDIAAMGARPLYATLSFMLPKAYAVEQVQEIFLGAAELAEEFGVQIIGGDTNSWRGKLVVGATLIGQVEHSIWRMSGARPGDAIVVTGEFGGSILSHHMDFSPRCQLAERLSGRYSIEAATDVSDALAFDLDQMCLLSGCGAEIELNKIPISPAAKDLANSQGGKSELEHALYDGEDFELILAVAPDALAAVLSDELFGAELTVVGRFVPGSTVIAIESDGSSRPLLIKGYTH
jgi:thiamine-monophosphate kinase